MNELINYLFTHLSMNEVRPRLKGFHIGPSDQGLYCLQLIDISNNHVQTQTFKINK